MSAFFAIFWNFLADKDKISQIQTEKIGMSNAGKISVEEDVSVVSKYVTQFMHGPCRRVNSVTGDASGHGSCSVTARQLNRGKFV